MDSSKQLTVWNGLLSKTTRFNFKKEVQKHNSLNFNYIRPRLQFE